MDVNGIGSAGNIQPLNHVNSIEGAAKPTEAGLGASVDKVEISEASRLLNEEVEGSSEVRAERLTRIRAAIDDGTYETTEKLEAALGRLLNEIGWNEQSG